MNNRGLFPKELAGAELVEGKLYYFAYSTNRSKEPITWCCHDEGSNMFYSLDDGPEMVATLEACEICGRVLPPRRVAKCAPNNVVALGSQAAAFKRLRAFIKSH